MWRHVNVQKGTNAEACAEARNLVSASPARLVQNQVS
jgi:hypothetical protein